MSGIKTDERRERDKLQVASETLGRVEGDRGRERERENIQASKPARPRQVRPLCVRHRV